jgi:type IV secretory pathway VirB10-like protein
MIDKLKNSQIIQYLIMAFAIYIFGYSVYSIFFKTEERQNRVVISDIVPEDIVDDDIKIDPLAQSINQDRRLEVLKDDTERSLSDEEMYIGKHYDTNRINDIVNDLQINLDGTKKEEEDVNITEPKPEEDVDRDLEIPELKLDKPPSRDLDNRNIETPDMIAEREARYLEEEERRLQKKIRLYQMVANSSMSKLPESHYYKKRKKIINSNYNSGSVSNKSNNTSSSSNYNNVNRSINNDIKIKVGSSYYGRLINSVNSAYSNSVRALIKINDGDLKGSTLVGNIQSTNSNLIISSNRLILPNGHEQSVQAIVLDPKNLTPALVDEVDRHLGERVLYSILGSSIDILANSESNNQYANTTTLFSNEVSKELNGIRSEVKVYPRDLVVVFY